MAMGMDKREKEDPSSPSSSSLLLFTTMCMVGLPVEIQVKDGSLYSGVFFTASTHNGNYGVVLKKARKIGKGKHETSFKIGSLIDTLVIFSDDLVQITVKDIVLPVEKSIDRDAGNGTEATTTGTAESRACVSRSDSCLRQVAKDMPEGESNSSDHIDNNGAPEANEIPQDQNHHLSSGDVSPSQVVQVVSSVRSHDAVNPNSHVTRVSHPSILNDMLPSSTSFPSSDAHTCTNSCYSLSKNTTSSCPSVPESPTVPISEKDSSVMNTKEFKLNPGAKDFSPSLTNFRPVPTVLPSITSPGFISNLSSVLPVAAAEPGFGISSFTTHASVPTKLVQYNGSANGHTGVIAQYPRHIVGHAASQPQPIRISGQYHSLPPGPAYMHPTPQFITGRTSQVVYVHPVAQDTTLPHSIFPRGSPYALSNPLQANIPKFQGNAAQPLQLYMAPPPLVTGLTPTFAVQHHIPFSQPFPVNRPVPVPGVNVYYGNSFP